MGVADKGSLRVVVVVGVRVEGRSRRRVGVGMRGRPGVVERSKRARRSK